MTTTSLQITESTGMGKLHRFLLLLIAQSCWMLWIVADGFQPQQQQHSQQRCSKSSASDLLSNLPRSASGSRRRRGDFWFRQGDGRIFPYRKQQRHRLAMAVSIGRTRAATPATSTTTTTITTPTTPTKKWNFRNNNKQPTESSSTTTTTTSSTTAATSTMSSIHLEELGLVVLPETLHAAKPQLPMTQAETISTRTASQDMENDLLLLWLLEETFEKQDEAIERALEYGYNPLQALLTFGGDDRCLIDYATGTNKYHIAPKPVPSNAIVRGSCTCNAPTKVGYQAAEELYQRFSMGLQQQQLLLHGQQQQQEHLVGRLVQIPLHHPRYGNSDDSNLLSTKVSFLSSLLTLTPKTWRTSASSIGAISTRKSSTRTTTFQTKSSTTSMKTTLHKWLNDEVTNVMEDQRRRISTCLQLPTGCEVVLVPSGSDAEYIPLAVARTLNPHVTDILNIITQFKEIGKGSLPAAGGQFFSTHAPLVGQLPPAIMMDVNDSCSFAPSSASLSSSSSTSSCVSCCAVGPVQIQTISIPARARDGSPIDTSRIALKKALEFETQMATTAVVVPTQNQKDAAAAADHHMASSLSSRRMTIVHGVFGGKTGIRDEIMPPSRIHYNSVNHHHHPPPQQQQQQQEAYCSSIGVVDACQGRFSLEELHSWLNQDSLVLFTASKFYQAPPFCGAVIIPKRIADLLRQVHDVPPAAQAMFESFRLGSFITDKELPDCLHSWKKVLQQEEQQRKNISIKSNHHTNNIGLALRWEAGLAEMERLAPTPDAERQAIVQEWASAVTAMIQAEPWLDVWCVERSIISIRLRRSPKVNGDSNQDDNHSNNKNENKHNNKDSWDDWLRMSELRDVYQFMSQDLSTIWSSSPSSWLQQPNHSQQAQDEQVLSRPIHLGQPVDVADSFAILRMALGVESMVQYLKDPTMTLAQDQLAVRKLAWIARHLVPLQQQQQQNKKH